MYKKVCEYCGKEFECTMLKTRCCGPNCYRKMMRQLAKNGVLQKPIRQSFQHVCEYCGKEFESAQYKRNTCSGSCYKKLIHRKMVNAVTDDNKKICVQCNKELDLSEFNLKPSGFYNVVCNDCLYKKNNRPKKYKNRILIRCKELGRIDTFIKKMRSQNLIAYDKDIPDLIDIYDICYKQATTPEYNDIELIYSYMFINIVRWYSKNKKYYEYERDNFNTKKSSHW